MISRKDNVVVVLVPMDGYGEAADGVVDGFDEEALRRHVSTLALAGDVEVFIAKDDPCSIKVDPIFVRPKKIGTIREQAVAPRFSRARWLVVQDSGDERRQLDCKEVEDDNHRFVGGIEESS